MAWTYEATYEIVLEMRLIIVNVLYADSCNDQGVHGAKLLPW